MRLHRMLSLISIVLAIVAWPVAAAVLAIERFVYPAHLYQPDAGTSLALDRIARVTATIPTLRSRFRAFVDRLLTHDDYRAGHFDPGRAVA